MRQCHLRLGDCDLSGHDDVMHCPTRTQGIHRGLGVHISKVRSCALDKWTPELVAQMENIGNARANAYWRVFREPAA